MTFGPFSSVLIGRLGNRVVMVSGGVICTVSLVASSFVTSLNVMFATFSFLYGIGTCMCTVPTMTITPAYFDKYLGVATGITVSGISFGTLLMSPLSQVIIVNDGWRTAFRVFAGFLCDQYNPQLTDSSPGAHEGTPDRGLESGPGPADLEELGVRRLDSGHRAGDVRLLYSLCALGEF
ncbi:hypothetical protein DPMN_051322 [Dreissena polymorpha]|uniref:Major facilitator superfamily (MFS) profile domain-containing protein n=1 Tax=Dreissena polymorpha TaxID=45954 RepID=A0A9D4CHN0_DREPO|nr:hypothetical protein DPMN_051322 [Dreissena polymorpha]